MTLKTHAKRLSTIAIYALGASTVPLIQKVMRHRDMDESHDDPNEIPEPYEDDIVAEDTKALWGKIFGGSELARDGLILNTTLRGMEPLAHREYSGRIPTTKHPKKLSNLANSGEQQAVETIPIKLRLVVNADDPFGFKIEDGTVVVNVVEGYIARLNDMVEPDKDGTYTVEVPEQLTKELRELARVVPDSPNLKNAETAGTLRVTQVSTSSYKDTDSGYRSCKYLVPPEEAGNIVHAKSNEKVDDDYEWANVPDNPWGALCSNPERVKRAVGDAPIIACTELPNNSTCRDYVPDTAVPVKVKLSNGSETDGIRVRTVNPHDRSMRAEVFAKNVRITDANYELITIKDDQGDNEHDTGNSPIRSIIRDAQGV